MVLHAWGQTDTARQDESETADPRPQPYGTAQGPAASCSEAGNVYNDDVNSKHVFNIR